MRTAAAAAGAGDFPDAITDGGGGTGMRRANTRRHARRAV
jgi:hypothetical protein